MLSNGIKLKITINQEDFFGIDFVVSLFDRATNIGLSLRSWKIGFVKKNYSFRLFLGPAYISAINLEKMNSHLNELLKNQSYQDYTEM